MGANFANVFARVRMPAVVLAHTGWNEEREWEWDWERPGIYLAMWRKAQANGRHVESTWVSSSHLPTPLLRLFESLQRRIAVYTREMCTDSNQFSIFII